MSAKRKAAANVFREQNMPNQQMLDIDEIEEAPATEALFDAELDDGAMLRRAAPSPMPAQQRARKPAAPGKPQKESYSQMMMNNLIKSSEEMQLEKEPLQVRETGTWLWKRVIAPPNAYVVHTRMGKVKTIGLGTSFRYNANTDAYLIVPAAMQTIGVVANCISKEKQGINVLAYVQWQIDDFSVAYRKLDISDSRDPLGIVNAQLGEQTEAAIKDKISTMTVEEVLTDKAPVIEELTTRLKAVAEGRQQGGEVNEGLGIKIVTVQIKEAIVSSQKLWEDLQAPFRHEKERTARISYLASQDEIKKKELETKQAVQTREAETQVEIERITQTKETEAAELRLAEESRRFSRTQESEREKLELEAQTTLAKQESEQRVATQKKRLEIEEQVQAMQEEARLAQARLAAEEERIEQEKTFKQLEAELAAQVQEQSAALAAQKLEAQLARQRDEAKLKLELQADKDRLAMELREREIELARLQQEVQNLINERDLTLRLIEKLPELAEQMPDIQELKVLQTGNGDGTFDTLAAFLTQTLGLANHLGLSLPSGEGNKEDSEA